MSIVMNAFTNDKLVNSTTCNLYLDDTDMINVQAVNYSNVNQKNITHQQHKSPR